jgi:hypothetical protein
MKIRVPPGACAVIVGTTFFLATHGFARSTMDGSLLFDPQYLPIILATLIGFSILAAALLVPVWRFLDREEKVARNWTPDKIEEHIQKIRAEHEAKEAEEDPSEEAFSNVGSQSPGQNSASSADAPSADAPATDGPSR